MPMATDLHADGHEKYRDKHVAQRRHEVGDAGDIARLRHHRPDQERPQRRTEFEPDRE